MLKDFSIFFCTFEKELSLCQGRGGGHATMNPTKDCTKNNLLLIIDFIKGKIQKFEHVVIGNKILLALR